MCDENEAAQRAQLATVRAKIAWVERYGGTVTPEDVRRLVEAAQKRDGGEEK